MCGITGKMTESDNLAQQSAEFRCSTPRTAGKMSAKASCRYREELMMLHCRFHIAVFSIIAPILLVGYVAAANAANTLVREPVLDLIRSEIQIATPLDKAEAQEKRPAEERASADKQDMLEKI
jgi:hypothetical protein